MVYGVGVGCGPTTLFASRLAHAPSEKGCGARRKQRNPIFRIGFCRGIRYLHAYLGYLGTSMRDT